MRLLLALGVMSAAVAGAATHEVKTSVTAEDIAYGNRILEAAGYAPIEDNLADRPDFEGQIAAILAVQDAVLSATPKAEALPHGQPREPKDVLEAGKGLCFDRSRAIEKMLSALGYETRHMAIYSTAGSGTLRALVTPGAQSHALSEVRTSKGWIAVDSNARWIGLAKDGTVHGIEALQQTGPSQTEWAAIVADPVSWPLFDEPFTYVIGLYSRHGGFFPPYNPVPDVNYAELLQNLY